MFKMIQFFCHYYSYRNASIGSKREAFMAGYIPESTPTTTQTTIPKAIHSPWNYKRTFGTYRV